MKYDVFISHSSLDSHIAFMLCKALEKQEFKCWIAPRNVKVGFPYAESIVDGIENSKTLIILFSTNANNSSGVLKELEVANNSQIPIIPPIRIEDIFPTKSMKFYIMANHWVDVLNPKSTDDFNSFIDEFKGTSNLKNIETKEETLIFSNISKPKHIYINREIDSILSNRIIQKKGCVLFLYGQGGIGKTKLLEKFSQTNRPTIFIQINESVNMSMVDIFLDDNKTTPYNCPKFEAKLYEIYREKEERNKIPFNAEFEILKAIREDFKEHGVFIVDTFEKNKNSHITSQIRFNNNEVKIAREESFYRFRDYLEELIYLFVSNTTFIIAGRNRIDDVNENRNEERYLNIDEVEEIEMINFSTNNIEQFIKVSKLESPTREQLNEIKNLTNGNPMLINLLVQVVKDYGGWSELDYNEMKKIVYEDKDYGLIYYFTTRIASHKKIDDIWKLIIPRVLTIEIEKILFQKKKVFEILVDVGLLHRGKGRERNIYSLHDDVALAIKSYANKEFNEDSLLSSWHDREEVRKIHLNLIEFYEKAKEQNSFDIKLEIAYHSVMIQENFERDFDFEREEYIDSLLSSISLSNEDKTAIVNKRNELSTHQQKELIRILKEEHQKWLKLFTPALYKELKYLASIGKLPMKFEKDIFTNKPIKNINTINWHEDIKFLLNFSKRKSLKSDWYIFYLLGIAYDNKGEYSQAIEAYKKAIEINPQKDEAYYNMMGNAYYDKKEYDKAIKAYMKITEINSKNDNAYVDISRLLIDFLGKYEEGIKYAKKAIEINPQKDVAYHNIGVGLTSLNKYEEAIEYYQKAVDLNSNRNDTYINLGVCFTYLGKYEEALKSYQQVLKINPKNAQAFHNMGMAYINMEEYQKGIEYTQKAISLNYQNYQNYQIYYNLVIAYYSLKEYDKAIEFLIKALEVQQDDSSAYTNLFELQLIQNQPFDQALEKKYIELFQNQKETFIHYEMLKILQNIVQNQEIDIEGWMQKYSSVSLSGWSFNELREWIDGFDEGEIKERLIEAVGVFEGHSEK